MITAAAVDVRVLKEAGLESAVYSSLSARRQIKADRYKFESGRLLSLGAGAALDWCLVSAGLREKETELGFASHGKPYIIGHGGLFFNLSHSGNIAVCAMAAQEIGADIEKYREAVSDALIRRVCTAREEERLFELDAGIRETEFCRLWTVKESYLKLRGTGLASPPESLDVSFERGDIALLDGETPAKAAFWQRDISGCWLTVCTEKKEDVSLTVLGRDELEKLYGGSEISTGRKT